MRAFKLLALAAIVTLPDVPAVAADTPVKGKIVGVDLFKNGLAIVKREVTLGKPGTYDLDDVPQPIHGTFWIDSTGAVDVVVKMRDVAVPAGDVAPGSLQDDLAGKKVTVHLKGANRAPVVGTMMKFKAAKPDEPANGRFLVIQTAKGRVYVEPSEVSSVESDDAGDTVGRRVDRRVHRPDRRHRGLLHPRQAQRRDPGHLPGAGLITHLLAVVSCPEANRQPQFRR